MNLTRHGAYVAFQEGSRLLAGNSAQHGRQWSRSAPPAARAARRDRCASRSPRVLPLQDPRFAEHGPEFRAALDLEEPVNDYAHYGLGLCRLRGPVIGPARAHLRLANVMRPDNADYQRGARAGR